MLGYMLYARLRSRHGDTLHETQRIWVIIGAAAGALFGSRVLAALEDPSQITPDPARILKLLQGRTIVGGLLGGLAGVEITKKFLRVRASTGDLFALPLIVAMIVGRAGCHLAGLADNTHGLPTQLPWGMDFGDGVRRHPTNLYEMLWLAATGAALWLYSRRTPPGDGAQFRWFMTSYLAWRFGIEFLKPQPVVALQLSTIQWACAAGLVYYAQLWIRLRRSARTSDGSPRSG